MPSRLPGLELGHHATPFETGRIGIVLLVVAFSIMSYFDRIIMLPARIAPPKSSSPPLTEPQ